MVPSVELDRWPRFLGSAALAVLIATICFLVPIPLMPYAGFNMESTMMGRDYAAMSLAPLSGHGPHPERILSPLLAWLLGLSGDRYWLFSHGSLIAFLAMAHHLTMTRSKDRLWATVFTFGLSISATCATYRGLVGYSDPTTFCLFCLCIRWLERPYVFWLLLGLGLLNHGQTIFMWPWIVYERARVARLGWRDGTLAAAGIASYLIVRALLVSDAPPPADSTSFYPATLTVSWYLEQLDWGKGIGLWFLILPCIPFCFGFFTIVLLWDLVGEQRRQAIVGCALLLVGICVMLILAIDIFRFVALYAFPMIAAMHRRLLPTRRMQLAMSASIALTLAVQKPHIALVSYMMDRYTQFYMEGHMAPVLTGMLPHLWWLFLGYAVLLALLTWAAHWTLARSAGQ